MRRYLYISLLLSLLIHPAIAQEQPYDLWSIYQEALLQDPGLKQAQAYRKASDHRESEARGRLLPQLELNNTFSRSQQDNEYQNIQYNGKSHALSLRQPLYDPSSWRNYQKFREQTLQQHLAADDSHNQTAFQIAELYFTALAAEDELALIQAEMEATLHNQQRIKALYHRQMAMRTDSLEVDARVATLQVNLLDAKNAVLTSRDAITERTGLPLTASLRRLSENPSFNRLKRDKSDWVRTALQNNPALRSQEHSLAAAENAFLEAKAGHLPKINLNLSAQRSDIGYEGNQSPKNSTLIATIGIQIPIYSGGSTSARSATLYAEKDAESYEYERLKRQIIRETRAALLQIETAPARIQAAEQAQNAAIQSRQAAERAFELGVLNAVEVLERVHDEFRARRDLLRSNYSYITNLLLLYRWSGTLNEQDIYNSNQLLTHKSQD